MKNNNTIGQDQKIIHCIDPSNIGQKTENAVQEMIKKAVANPNSDTTISDVEKVIAESVLKKVEISNN